MVLPVEPNPDDPVGGGGGSIAVGTPIFTVQFDKDRSDSILRVLAYASLSSDDDLQFTGFLTINGTIHQAGKVNAIFANLRAAMPITLPSYVNDLPAGRHVIVFSILNQEPDSALTVLSGSTIEITELKRAAL